MACVIMSISPTPSPTPRSPFPQYDVKKQIMDAAETGPSGDETYSFHNNVADEGVRAATDAHELVSSLRSEVAALERHRSALQANVDRLEEAAAAAAADGKATAAAWITAAARRKTKASSNANNAATEVAAVVGSSEPAEAVVASQRERRARARLERRAGAAAVLSDALSNGGPTSPARKEPPSVEAAAVEFRRNARREVQEAFVSRRLAEAPR